MVIGGPLVVELDVLGMSGVQGEAPGANSSSPGTVGSVLPLAVGSLIFSICMSYSLGEALLLVRVLVMNSCSGAMARVMAPMSRAAACEASKPPSKGQSRRCMLYSMVSARSP